MSDKEDAARYRYLKEFHVHWVEADRTRSSYPQLKFSWDVFGPSFSAKYGLDEAVDKAMISTNKYYTARTNNNNNSL